jgi:hypothetical protein
LSLKNGKKKTKGKKKAGKKNAQNQDEEIEIMDGGNMEAKFFNTPGKSKKKSKSKDKSSKNLTMTSSLEFSTRPVKVNLSKLVKSSDSFENTLAHFNSMLTFSVLKSKHWTRETFYDTTYCTFLEQFIELVPKINQRKTFIFHCPGFVKGFFELTFKLLKYNSQVHFSEA